jgi:O-antigen ligase
LTTGATPAWRAAGLGAAAAAACAVGLAAAALPPPVAVGAVVAVCALPLLLARPLYAVYIAIALLSIDRGAVVDIGDATVKLSHALFGLALAGALAERAVSGRPLFSVPPAAGRLLVAGLVLAATQALSFLAGWPGTDTAVARVAIIIGGAFVPFLAIVLLVNSRERFRTATSVFLIAQLAVAALGLYEFASLQLGLPAISQNIGVVAGAGRVAGFALEPGYYAAGLVTALPLLVYLIVRDQSRASLPWTGAVDPRLALGVVLIALAVANSRAGYLLTAVALALTLLLLARAGVISVAGLRRAVAGGAVFLVLALLASQLLGARPFATIGQQVQNSLISPTLCQAFRENNACTSNIERFELYTAGRDIFLDHPILGVGDGAAGDLLPQYGVVTFVNREATLNNVLLEVGAESGLVGLAALAFLVWRLAVMAVPRRDDGDDALLARTFLLGGVVLLTAGGLVLMWLWDVRLWSLLALGAAGLAVAARENA